MNTNQTQSILQAIARADKFGEKSWIGSVFFCSSYSDPAAFTADLLELRASGVVRLSRCDLVPVVGREIVEQSEVEYENARFHFAEAV